jgi:hypothetical protein
MLVSKITPSAKKVVEVSPFSSTTKDLSYMTAIARPYAAGAEKTTFQVQFGELITNNEGVVQRFESQMSSQVVLTKEELSTWGTNDEVLLNIICSKLGITSTEFIEISREMF